MKKLVFLLFITISFAACLKTKSTPEPERILDYLTFLQVNGPSTVTIMDTINFQIRVAGNKSCYIMEGYEGKETADKQYEIRAVGSYPNPVYGDTLNCNGSPFVKDTIVKFTPRAEGKQVFRFYNRTNLFSTDTVLVTR